MRFQEIHLTAGTDMHRIYARFVTPDGMERFVSYPSTTSLKDIGDHLDLLLERLAPQESPPS